MGCSVLPVRSGAINMYARQAGGGVGTPPVAGTKGNLGVPPAQPHIESAPYDAAIDPAWKGILDPNDHELRNFINQQSPEDRQMLLQRVAKMGGKGGAQPPAMPPAAMPPMIASGPGSAPPGGPPPGASPAPGM